MNNYKNIIQGRTLMMLIFSAALITYVFIRAYTLSFTHDESLSFTIIARNSHWTKAANHHVLNTTLMSLSSFLFGNKEFSLRLPNVLSFILYLTGSFFIYRSSKNNWLFFLAISLTLLNPFLIEFFSLARGYGLSLAFMLMGLFFFNQK